MPFDGAVPTFLDDLERHRVERPGQPFIFSHESVLTYGEVARLAAGFADFLRASGVAPGDRVGLLLPRVPELIVAFLGAMRAGALPVPVNYTVGAEAIRSFVAGVAPAVTVAHDRPLRQHRLDPRELTGTTVVAVGADMPGATPWSRACVPGPVGPVGPAGPGRADATAYLNYTTGTTGAPRGALATHANLYWNTRSAIEAFGFTADDVHLCMFASFAHPHELFARALHLGGAVALLEEVNPRTIARTIRERGVTAMMGLAPMYDMLIAHCSGAGLGALRIAESGGMYTRPATITGFQRHFGIPVLSVWGSTETTGIALANTPSAFRTDGSAGRACPHYDVRIVDENGSDVPDGTIGELVFSGPAVVAGYRETAVFPTVGGAYRSGDLARRDAEGYHYFVERTSGLLKVAGLKVYPFQIEKVLLEHPAVRDAAVVGVDDRLRGVVPKAFVIAKDGRRLDPEELRRHCRAHLPDYAVPRDTQLVEEFPRIGSGKVDKAKLRATHGAARPVAAEG